MKKRITALASACLIFAFASTASAHVIIAPNSSLAGAYEQYTLRAPGELPNANFTKLRLEFPSKIKFFLIGQPVNGWNYEFEKDENGTTKALIWTATAGGVKPGEFTEFTFMGNNTMEEGEVTWKAFQTYSDGTVVPWSGDKPEFPAPATTIKPSAGFDHHGNPLKPGETDKGHGDETATAAAASATPADAAKKEATPAATTTETSSSKLPIYLSGAALLVSLGALGALLSLLRKRS